ncbi:MAG TPA: hypothetical protein VHZ03_57100 [Trebonia sp.]|nr:hypothetical protein [Trebonia sp.]
MATRSCDTPGHDDGNLHVRAEPARVVNGMIEGGYTGSYELICPACGDDDNLDYQSARPELQALRGPYGSMEAGRPQPSTTSATRPSSRAPTAWADLITPGRSRG